MTPNQLKVLFVLIALPMCLAVNAQKKLDFPESFVGIQGGATASRINFIPAVKQSYLLGYNTGISFRHISHKVAGIQAELNYSQRGWAEKDGLYTRQLDYLELPFMTHFYFGKKVGLFINIGPKISYLISEKTIVNQTLNSNSEQHIKAVHNKFDYGFCGGPGLMININGQIILLETRANFSISDVFSNAKRDYFAMSNNMNVSVNLGWQLKIR